LNKLPIQLIVLIIIDTVT